MSEEGIDLRQGVDAFATPGDLAFAVELENASNEPVTLLDTRLGNSYGKAKGKPKSDWIGQFLFTIELLDGSGAMIERPHVDVTGSRDLVLRGASLITLDPGGRHRFLLRPTKWLSAMTHRLAAGSFTAVVHYHGLPNSAAERIRAYQPEHPVLQAWSGDLASPPVSFAIRGPANNAATKDLWGPTSKGLRAAVELLPSSHIVHGETVELKLHLQNAGKEPVSLATALTLTELRAVVRDERGTRFDVSSTWYSGLNQTGRIELQSGQTVILDAGNLAVASNGEQASRFEHVTNRTLIVPPGRYQVQLVGQLPGFERRDGQGNKLMPLEMDWVGTVKTGFCLFDVELGRGELDK